VEVENPFQSPEIMKDTCMKKYGVEYTMQNPEISEKSMLKDIWLEEFENGYKRWLQEIEQEEAISKKRRATKTKK